MKIQSEVVKVRAKQILAVVAVIVFCLCVGFFASRASRFRFSEIIVATSTGNSDIETMIKRELVSELGHNLFSISLVDVEKRLLNLAPIESVKLHRVWPSSLMVEATIKTPVALVFQDGKLWTIGKNSQPIESVKNPPPLPLLIHFEGLMKVRTSLPQSEMTKEFLGFLEELQNSEGSGNLDLSKISEVRWSPERGIVLWSYELGVEVDLGFERFQKSWTMAERAFNWANERNIALSQIDASYSTRVVLRPKLKLQNSQIGLNLEELVHRKDSGPAAAR